VKSFDPLFFPPPKKTHTLPIHPHTHIKNSTAALSFISVPLERQDQEYLSIMCFSKIALQGCPQQKGEQGEEEEECSRRGRRRRENASQVFGGGVWGRCMNEEEAWVCVWCHGCCCCGNICAKGQTGGEKRGECDVPGGGVGEGTWRT
jgi:hypothetical protein